MIEFVKFSFSFVALLLLSLNPVIAQSFVVDGILYNVTSSNTVSVAENENYSGEVVIPDSVIDINNKNVYYVTYVEDKAFANPNFRKLIQFDVKNYLVGFFLSLPVQFMRHVNHIQTF